MKEKYKINKYSYFISSCYYTPDNGVCVCVCMCVCYFLMHTDIRVYMSAILYKENNSI